MSLNPVTSKIFWKMLQGPEVLPKFFTFGFLSNDSKASMFSKMLKKRNSEQVSTIVFVLADRCMCGVIGKKKVREREKDRETERI